MSRALMELHWLPVDKRIEYRLLPAAPICFQNWGGGKIRIGGAKIDYGDKTLYVYLLTFSILYKNIAYFGGKNDVFVRTIYYWVGNRYTCPPMIDALGTCYIRIKHCMAWRRGIFVNWLCRMRHEEF